MGMLKTLTLDPKKNVDFLDEIAMERIDSV